MPDIELKIKSRDIATLIETIHTKRPDANTDLVKKAYVYSEEKHKNQKRLSGEPYIIHPLEVAIILSQLNMDTTAITAALLHDVVEDTPATLEDIGSLFGKDVAVLVDGVTKISSLKKRTKSHNQAETLRKMLMATINDPRVIVIKLADKIHNMRTIMFQPPVKQETMANEVLEIYAPLAGRLGMSKVRAELEGHGNLSALRAALYAMREKYTTPAPEEFFKEFLDWGLSHEPTSDEIEAELLK